jgi:CheY-like chemotaxis protein
MDALAQILSGDAPRMLRKKLESVAEVEAGPAPAPANRARVLIVEDNLVNQMVLAEFIDQDEFEVIIADNGAKAVEMFQQHAPAIVMMDISMPVMGGLEATAKIRAYEAEKNLSRTPIVATTAHVLEEDRQRCHNAGMDDFLPKPMKKASVDAAFDRWLRSSEDRTAQAG